MLRMSKYFFCYSIDLRTFLKTRGFNYVCTGLHPKTKRQFWLFERNERLNNDIDRFYTIING